MSAARATISFWPVALSAWTTATVMSAPCCFSAREAAATVSRVAANFNGAELETSGVVSSVAPTTPIRMPPRSSISVSAW